MARKTYEDDDGRTVADMSDLERAPLLVPHLRKRRGANRSREDTGLSKSERRAFIFGTLSATLLIAFVFFAAFLILILVLLWAWG